MRATSGNSGSGQLQHEDGITCEMAKLLKAGRHQEITDWDSLWMLLFPNDIGVPSKGMVSLRSSSYIMADNCFSRVRGPGRD